MMTRLRSARPAVLALLGLLLGSCDEADLTSIRLSIASDGSGTVRVSTVAVPEPRPAVEHQSTGATWQQRVTLDASVGRFDDISNLQLADLAFHRDVNSRGIVTLEVIVPIGPDALWVRLLAPMTESQRTETAQAFDETGRTRSLGATVKIAIELPQEVVASELDTFVRGLSTAREGRTATLTLPVDEAAERTGSVSWIITWRRQSEDR